MSWYKCDNGHELTKLHGRKSRNTSKDNYNANLKALGTLYICEECVEMYEVQLTNLGNLNAQSLKRAKEIKLRNNIIKTLEKGK